VKATQNTRNTRNTWTVKVDGQKTTFTKLDVALYFGTRHGKSGLRTFGSVRGDWRMIDKIANDAQAYFVFEEP
jgi:hypothetical protein